MERIFMTNSYIAHFEELCFFSIWAICALASRLTSKDLYILVTLSYMNIPLVLCNATLASSHPE
jgi:hypothetical protein